MELSKLEILILNCETLEQFQEVKNDLIKEIKYNKKRKLIKIERTKELFNNNFRLSAFGRFKFRQGKERLKSYEQISDEFIDKINELNKEYGKEEVNKLYFSWHDSDDYD